LQQDGGPPHFEGKASTFHDDNFPMWVVTVDRLCGPQHFPISDLVIFPYEVQQRRSAQEPGSSSTNGGANPCGI
jgi:hypothetical protein